MWVEMSTAESYATEKEEDLQRKKQNAARTSRSRT